MESHSESTPPQEQGLGESQLENGVGEENLSEQHEETISKEEMGEIIVEIKKTYEGVVNEILDDGDPLKEKILEYFVNRADVDDEYTYILSNLSDTEKKQYPDSLRNSLSDSGAFINKMERYFSTQAIHESEKQLKEQPRTATPEEYEIGAYADFLEPQVKDAVFALQSKGYKTFQSGYSEKDPKNQFIDFYNADVLIPGDVVEVLRSKGLEVLVENFDDRTTVTLHPTDTKSIIRQDE
ncbi:hypothetical protein IPH92_01805 [Candidatus Kaiserbacteria bacterium]|nr:MAG: hypothetical protein IPH92_01805 [Candidatus Kaiserbacteria bacterium]